MDEPPTFRVWGRPSLGGWLSMLNASVWVALLGFIVLIQPDPSVMAWVEAPLGFIIFFFSLPIACPFILPGGPPRGDPVGAAIGAAVILGLNAFAWGYGLAWLIGGVKKWISLFRGRSTTTGDASNANG